MKLNEDQHNQEISTAVDRLVMVSPGLYHARGMFSNSEKKMEFAHLLVLHLRLTRRNCPCGNELVGTISHDELAILGKGHTPDNIRVLEWLTDVIKSKNRVVLSKWWHWGRWIVSSSKRFRCVHLIMSPVVASDIRLMSGE